MQRLITTWVDGMFKISGFQYTFNASNPAGQRITSVTFNGAPLDRNATYTVAANSFLATGGDGFTVFKEASASQQILGSDLDALEDYVGSLQQPFSAPSDSGQRITRQGWRVYMERFRGRGDPRNRSGISPATGRGLSRVRTLMAMSLPARTCNRAAKSCKLKADR